MKLIVVGLLTIASGAVTADATACGKSEVHTSEMGNLRSVLVLDEAKVARTAPWRPGNGEPALSIARATTIALAWGKQQLKGFDSVEPQQVVLVAYPCSSQAGRWYYRVDLVPIKAGQKRFEKSIFTAVLLDGTLVPPVVTEMSPNKSLERTRDR
jgi:hypothetical protein